MTLITTLSSCSFKDDVDNSLDNIEEMKDTTKSMDQKMDTLSQKTAAMEDELGSAIPGLRDAASQGVQLNVLDSLTRYIEDGRQYENLLPKAVIYINAMTSEYYFGKRADDQRRRSLMWARDLELLFSTLYLYVDDSMPAGMSTADVAMGWVSAAKARQFRAHQVLSTITVLLSKPNPTQFLYAEEAGFEVVSFYQLITQALEQEDRFDRGEECEPHVRIVLKYKSIAVYLMQLRHNYLLGLVAAQLGSVEDHVHSVLDERVYLLRHTKMNWNIDLGLRGLEELKDAIGLLKKAKDTQDFLTKQNIPLQFDPNIADLWDNGVFYFDQQKAIKGFIAEDLVGNPVVYADSVIRNGVDFSDDRKMKMMFAPSIYDNEKTKLRLNTYTELFASLHVAFQAWVKEGAY